MLWVDEHDRLCMWWNFVLSWTGAEDLLMLLMLLWIAW